MPAYLYATNVSPRDRFEQLEIQMDNGSTAVINRGSAYSLSANEVVRARRFVVLLDAATVTATPRVVTSLPVVGNFSNGDVPVWSKSLASFVAGGIGNPTLRFEQDAAALVTSRAHHASRPVSYNRARLTADAVASSTVSIVTVNVNGVIKATLGLSSGQSSAITVISVTAVDGDAITVTRVSTEGGGVVVELDNS
jgi:hypothetical protein